MKRNEKEFKAELKALLLKYNADIGFDCSDSSDTMGIYGERIVARLGEGREEETIHLVHGWCVEGADL